MRVLNQVGGIVLLVAMTTPAIANTSQDLFGAGARSKAMGGVGTASAVDGSSTYYNPARLSQCKESQVALDVSHLSYALKAESTDALPQAASLRDRPSVATSACLHLPRGLSVGFAFETGVQGALRLEQSSLDDTPIFAMYGAQLETISVMAGVSYELSNKLSLGLGTAILANSSLGVGVQVPIINNEDELSAAIKWKLEPAVAIHAGASYQVNSQWLLAAAFRSALYHKLEGEVRTRVDVAGVLLDVDLLVESVAWYSPLQASVGASYQHADTLMSADLTWYQWSAYAGPALRIRPLDPDDTVAAGLNYPAEEDAGFRDIWVPRVGAEHTISDALSLRIGMAYRPSTLPVPKAEQQANLLDASTTTLSVGAGYRLASKSDEKSGTASTTKIDIHAGVHHQGEQHAEKRNEGQSVIRYTYGGQIYDFGVSLTMGW